MSALLRWAKAFKHGKTQCTNIAFNICFARLKIWYCTSTVAHLMNAVNAKDGASILRQLTDLWAERRDWESQKIPQTCVLESAPEVVLGVIHG